MSALSTDAKLITGQLWFQMFSEGFPSSKGNRRGHTKVSWCCDDHDNVADFNKVCNLDDWHRIYVSGSRV